MHSAIAVALALPAQALALPRSTLDRPDDVAGKQIHVVYALPRGTNASGELLFCPDDPVTRRDMAVFIVRAKGLSQSSPSSTTFSDVPASMFGFGHVERMYEQGITTGCFFDPTTGERRYCPLALVTPRDMAVLMIRAKSLAPLTPATATFSDVPASLFGFGHVERMFEQGITTGCSYDAGTGERRYCPLENVSRQAMAAFLLRAFRTP